MMENPFDLNIHEKYVHHKIKNNELDLFLYTSDCCSDIPDEWIHEWVRRLTDPDGDEVCISIHFTINDIVESMIQGHSGTDGVMSKSGALYIHALQKDMRKALHKLENLTFRADEDD